MSFMDWLGFGFLLAGIIVGLAMTFNGDKLGIVAVVVLCVVIIATPNPLTMLKHRRDCQDGRVITIKVTKDFPEDCKEQR